MNAARRHVLAGRLCDICAYPLGMWRQRTLNGVREGRVKVVNDLGKTGRRLLVAGFVEHEDLNVPGLHWVTLHFRGLVTAGQKSAWEPSIV